MLFQRLHVSNKRYYNNTVYHSSMFFVGMIIWGLFNPVTQVILWGCPTTPPIFWQAHPHALAVSFEFFVNSGFLPSSMVGMKPPLFRQWGSLFLWVGVFCIKEEDASSSLSSVWRGTYLFHSPTLFGLANHDPVWWVVTSVLVFTICQCQWYMFLLTSMATSH